MRYLLTLLLLIFISSISKAQFISTENKILTDTLQYAEIKFDTTSQYKEFHIKDEYGYYEFPFTNIGNAPLIIESCLGSSGCVVAYCQKEPILPNHKGVIKVHYDTSQRIGRFNKSVSVTSNAKINQHVVLIIRGTVTEITQYAEIKFDTTTQYKEYKLIDKDKGASYEFPFINIGNVPLVITDCKTTGGATCATYPKEPILPNQKSIIKVHYSIGGIGEFNKCITVFSNSVINPIVLQVQGTTTE